MIRAKYVVFDGFYAVIVSPSLSHNSASIAVKGKDPKPTSAGFFKVCQDENGKIDVIVYGESDTLQLAADTMDSFYVKQSLGLFM